MKAKLNRIVPLGIVYLLLGIASALISNPLPRGPVQMLIRVGFFVMALAAFLFHLRSETLRFRQGPRAAAFMAAGSVSLGVCLLAIYANIAVWLERSSANRLLILAIVVWPLITGAGALLAGFVLANITAKRQRRSG